jgi:hypothetical protein
MNSTLLRLFAISVAVALPVLAGGEVAPVVPEPSLIMVTALGLGGIILAAKKRRGK